MSGWCEEHDQYCVRVSRPQQNGIIANERRKMKEKLAGVLRESHTQEDGWCPATRSCKHDARSELVETELSRLAGVLPDGFTLERWVCRQPREGRCDES